MNYKKYFKAINLIIFFIVLIILSRVIIFAYNMNSSVIVVQSNKGVIEKGHTLKYWDIKQQEKEDQVFVYMSIAHSKNWLYVTTPYSGISHLFMVFKNNKLEYAKSIFNGELFIFAGSAELSKSDVKNIVLKSTNEGVNYKSIQYLIKKVNINNVETDNVEDYFSLLKERLDKYENFPIR